MKGILGKVGSTEVKWLSVPRGPRGSAYVELHGGIQLEVSWRKDADGIWIELPAGVSGFDIQGDRSDEGAIQYRIDRRGGSESFSGLCFLRSGEEVLATSAGKAKKGIRVRAQMPGKIVKVCTQEGSKVEKGDPLIIMEAMKMENQIRASQGGIVKKVAVSEGATVESGAELVVIDFEVAT